MSRFERDVLLRIAMHDPLVAKEVVDLFSVEWPELIYEMKRAVKPQDHRKIEISAHRIKGNLMIFGAHAVAALAGKIEEQARGESLDGVAQCLLDLEQELIFLNAELSEFVKSLR